VAVRASFHVLAALLALTEAGCDAAEGGDGAHIVPEGLAVRALAGGNGVLDVVALTLRKGSSNVEVYAALKNVGDAPACDAAFSIELFDASEQSLAAGIGGLVVSHFYRLKDDAQQVVGCVGPGDVAMAAVTDLPSEVAIDEVGFIVYRCPYFALDVVPIDGLTIRDVRGVTSRTGTVYTGTLVNGFDRTIRNPAVSVFPVNRVSRPLGIATRDSPIEVPPGESWKFETNAVDVRGERWVAYPAAALED
jgi:hypothetical protein